MSRIELYLGMLIHSNANQTLTKYKNEMYKADQKTANRFRLLLVLHVLLSALTSYLIIRANPQIFISKNSFVFIIIQLLLFVFMWLVFLPFAAILLPGKLKSRFTKIDSK